MQSSQTIPLAIVLGGVIIAVAVYATVRPQVEQAALEAGNPALVRPVDSADHIFGNPGAKVKIIEYSDFDCGYCKTYDATLRALMAEVGGSGDVAWIFRHYPIRELHPNAYKHAEAAACAAQTGGTDAFWKFSASLFANQPASPSRYGEFAQAAGIPTAAFATCMQNAATTVDARINADIENGTAAGARGTPYTILVADGKKPVALSGAYSYAELKAAVEQMLSAR